MLKPYVGLMQLGVMKTNSQVLVLWSLRSWHPACRRQFELPCSTCLHKIRDQEHLIPIWRISCSWEPPTYNKSRIPTPSVPKEPLFSVMPALAEHFYRVLHNLCMHRETSDFTMRYLRTREDFFVRQLAALPFQPISHPIPNIEVRYSNGSRVATTVEAFTSFLRLRSLVFDLVSLDLHILTNRGHLKGVSELLELIYGNEQRQLDVADWEDETFQITPAVGQ